LAQDSQGSRRQVSLCSQVPTCLSTSVYLSAMSAKREAFSPVPSRNRRRPESSPSQADLMAGRGELQMSRATFEAQLPRPPPVDLPSIRGSKSVARRRVGMDVECALDDSRLRVASVDNNPRHSTPVAKWNAKETKQAHRGEFERHASNAILPGDRIRSVNNSGSAANMLQELESATGTINLELSRNLKDVLKPSLPPAPDSRLSTPANHSPPSTPEKPPSKRPRSSCTPAMRPRSGFDECSTRLSRSRLGSAQSTRAPSGASSRCNSVGRCGSAGSCSDDISCIGHRGRSSSIGSISSISMLSHAGFVALCA